MKSIQDLRTDLGLRIGDIPCYIVDSWLISYAEIVTRGERLPSVIDIFSICSLQGGIAQNEGGECFVNMADISAFLLLMLVLVCF